MSDYDREREGQVEHVSEYTRMQDVRDAASAPSMLALQRPRPALPAGPVGSLDVAWERRHYIDTHYPDGTVRPAVESKDEAARPWDRVLWGLGEMAAEKGLVPTARAGYDEAGNIWHYPTASMDDSYTREHVLRDMERSLGPQFGPEAGRSEEQRLQDTRDALRFERVADWRISSAERGIPTKDDIESTASMELDAAIKNDYPNIRRNSKQYKDLYASHHAGAIRVYTRQGEESKTRAVAELERERSEMAEPARKVRADAEYHLRRVRWIETLVPGSEIAARERRIAERQVDMADEYDRRLDSEIARVKNLAVGREGRQRPY